MEGKNINELITMCTYIGSNVPCLRKILTAFFVVNQTAEIFKNRHRKKTMDIGNLYLGYKFYHTLQYYAHSHL